MAGTSTLSDQIKLLALGLGVGQTAAFTCPSCSRQSMYITRQTSGSLAYCCHRLMCGVRGYTGSRYDGEGGQEQGRSKPEVQVDSTALPDEVHNWLCSRYNLEPETIHEEGLTWWEKHGRVLSPVNGLMGKRYGYSARAVRSGFTGPKSLTIVQDTSWPGGLFTRMNSGCSALIVVEDPFSAYAAAEYGYRACALLGTHLTPGLEEQLQLFEEVVIALDADAVGKAAAMVHQLGYLNVRQIVLEKDIKDMNLAERSAVLGSY